MQDGLDLAETGKAALRRMASRGELHHAREAKEYAKRTAHLYAKRTAHLHPMDDMGHAAVRRAMDREKAAAEVDQELARLEALSSAGDQVPSAQAASRPVGRSPEAAARRDEQAKWIEQHFQAPGNMEAWAAQRNPFAWLLEQMPEGLMRPSDRALRRLICGDKRRNLAPDPRLAGLIERRDKERAKQAQERAGRDAQEDRGVGWKDLHQAAE